MLLISQKVSLLLRIGQTVRNGNFNLMSKLGYFTDNSVQRVRELLTGVHDFTRCERLDGTHYGTAGRCRKGVEVGQENEKRSIQKAFDEGEAFGKGDMGEVRLNAGPPPTVIKKGKIGQHEAEALTRLSGTGLAPSLVSVTPLTNEKLVNRIIFGGHVTSGDGMIQMKEAKGKPLSSQSLSKEQKVEQIDSMMRARARMHLAGIAHNDTHDGNVFYDPKTKRTMFVDFGLSQIGSRHALVEALLTNKDSSSRTAFGEDGGQGSVLYRKFQENWGKVVSNLKFDSNDSVEIRTKEADLPPAIRNLSNSEVKEFLKSLYEGIL
jgi:serine/threonine protein kinase